MLMLGELGVDESLVLDAHNLDALINAELFSFRFPHQVAHIKLLNETCKSW